MNLTDILVGTIAFLLGIVIGKIIFSKNTRKRIGEAESEAKQMITAAELKAETIIKEKILEAKEKFVQLKAEFDKWEAGMVCYPIS